MLITREIDYALRLVLFLSEKKNLTKKTPMKIISEKMNIPHEFSRKIAKCLVTSKIIISSKGKNGGLQLKMNPEEISIFDIMKSVEPNSTKINKCIINPKICNRSNICNMNNELIKINNELENSLSKVFFDKLINKQI